MSIGRCPYPDLLHHNNVSSWRWTRCHKFFIVSSFRFSFAVFSELRLDWLSGNWYFLNEDDGLVYLCTNAVNYCRLILHQVEHPSSLVLDPTKGYLFYTDWSPSLSRALLDGSNRTALVKTNIYHPSGITLDLANEHVYWIDVYKDVIERVDYNGKQRWTLKKTPNVSCCGRW